VTVCTNIH